jgi:hypothetical protein
MARKYAALSELNALDGFKKPGSMARAFYAGLSGL